MSIDWSHLEQKQFDRIVEALIARRYGETARVHAVNGRGGDGGIDIEVRQGDRLRIFQLKFFPEGFSGGFANTRRTQITRSYLKMLDEDPYEWTLVVPNTLTPGERDFVNKLGNGASTPRREIVDRTKLDLWVIDHPEVDRWAQRNVTSELLENAKIYNREIDNLLGPDDLSSRVADLGALADSIDLDWTYDFHREGNIVRQVLRPQHPSAHTSSPIHITIHSEFGPQHTELHEQYLRKIRFGTADPVELPPETVRGLAITGPSHVAREFDSGHVVLGVGTGATAPGVGRPIELRFFDHEGTPFAAHEGRITHLGKGTHGLSVKAVFYDNLTAEMTLPGPSDHTSDPAGAQLSYSIYRARPRVVVEVLRFVRQMRTAHQVKVFIDGEFAVSLGTRGDNSVSTEDLVLEEFAADLDRVQQHCGQYFAFPDHASALDRIQIRVARILLDGGIVASPQANTVTLTLSGVDSPHFRTALQTSPGPVLMEFANYTVPLGNRVLPIGPVWVFHRAASLVDPPAVLAALDAGQGAGLEVDYQPAHDAYFLVALADRPPERLNDQPETLWELTGITQPRSEQFPPDTGTEALPAS